MERYAEQKAAEGADGQPDAEKKQKPLSLREMKAQQAQEVTELLKSSAAGNEWATEYLGEKKAESSAAMVAGNEDQQNACKAQISQSISSDGRKHTKISPCRGMSLTN